MKRLRLMDLAGRGSSRIAVGLVIAALSSLAWPHRAFASELDLQIPADRHHLHDLRHAGLGLTLLYVGLAVCLLGMLFGLACSAGSRSCRCTQSMPDVSNIIYETCKTYLLQQGRLLIVLEVFIGACIVYYFGVLQQLRRRHASRSILLFSVVGILGLVLRWPGTASASTPTPTAAPPSPRCAGKPWRCTTSRSGPACRSACS